MESEIHKLIEDRVKAVRAKDIEALVAAYEPTVLSFDVVNPLQARGSQAIRKRLDEWFSSFEGPLDFEIEELVVVVDHDVAFCHGLSRVSGTTTQGSQLNMWYRTTIGYRRVDGKWVITHEHNSVPFDPATGKASLALQP
jgi:uncharacterized protein (TIGR02246 family)